MTFTVNKHKPIKYFSIFIVYFAHSPVHTASYPLILLPFCVQTTQTIFLQKFQKKEIYVLTNAPKINIITFAVAVKPIDCKELT